MNDNLVNLIKKKSIELGFDGCGIIKIEELTDYKKIIDEKFGNNEYLKYFHSALSKLAKPDKYYDWAKSIIVCVNDYSKYSVPDNIDKHIAKYYLFDYKQEPRSDGYKRIFEFENYLKEIGLKIHKDPIFGVAPMRYVAEKANLGIVRNNNFFYNKNGSWVLLESWLLDKELELKEPILKVENCPPNCNKCAEACPTKALYAPHKFDYRLCITRLSYGALEITPEKLRDKIGEKIYGCDECQNACPMNKNFKSNVVPFPGIEDLKDFLNPYEILKMSLDDISLIFGKKFWFISKERPWVWKCNAIIALANKKEGFEVIKEFINDENNEIKETAIWALNRFVV